MGEGETEGAGRESRVGRVERIVIIASVALAFALRAWALYRRNVLDFDETYYYILGRNLVTGSGYTLNGLPHTAFPPLYPFLVGVTSFFTSSIRAATSLVSAAAGGLLPLPVYFLGREIHGRRAGAFAALAAAVWPALFFTAAGGVAYPLRMYFGSEPLYTTLAACGMLFLWLLCRHGRWRNAILAGVFFGLASLTRSEGPVLFSSLLLWLVICLAATRRLWRPRTLVQVSLVAAAMLAAFSPFLIHIRCVNGAWGLGAKLTNNARVRDTLFNWVELNDSTEFLKTHYALNDDATQMSDPYWGVSPWHIENMADKGSLRGGLSLVLDPDWRWLGVFARVFYKSPAPLAPWYAWVLVIAGLFFPPWNARRVRWWGFIAAAFVPMLVLAVSLYVLRRHELPLVTLLAVSLGKGLDAAGALLARGVRAALLVGGLFTEAFSLFPAALVCSLLLVSGVNLNRAGNLLAGGDVSPQAQRRQRLVADWLREHLDEPAALMSHTPWMALWSGNQWRVAPYAGPRRILEYARNRGIRYAVLEGWHPGTGEGARLLEPYLVGKPAGGARWYVYDFARSAGGSGAAAP